MMKKAALKNVVSTALMPAGFVCKGQSWFLVGQHSIVVFNLQKSDFNEKCFLNFGVWLNSLGANRFPAENKCHIQARLTTLFPTEADAIDRACRLDNDETDLAWLSAFLRDKVAPYCRDCLRTDRLREMIENGKFNKALVMTIARDALRTDNSDSDS